MNTSKKVPKAELEVRLKRFCDRMNTVHPEREVAVIFSKVNLFYFTGTMQEGMLYIPREKVATLWVRRGYERDKRISFLKYFTYEWI